MVGWGARPGTAFDPPQREVDPLFEEVVGALEECVSAIGNADCPPEAFGIGGNDHPDEGTHWYLRDELLNRARSILSKIKDLQVKP